MLTEAPLIATHCCCIQEYHTEAPHIATQCCCIQKHDILLHRSTTSHTLLLYATLVHSCATGIVCWILLTSAHTSVSLRSASDAILMLNPRHVSDTFINVCKPTEMRTTVRIEQTPLMYTHCEQIKNCCHWSIQSAEYAHVWQQPWKTLSNLSMRPYRPRPLHSHQTGPLSQSEMQQERAVREGNGWIRVRNAAGKADGSTLTDHMPRVNTITRNFGSS